jgi:hypothetical protein
MNQDERRRNKFCLAGGYPAILLLADRESGLV